MRTAVLAATGSCRDVGTSQPQALQQSVETVAGRPVEDLELVERVKQDSRDNGTVMIQWDDDGDLAAPAE